MSRVAASAATRSGEICSLSVSSRPTQSRQSASGGLAVAVHVLEDDHHAALPQVAVVNHIETCAGIPALCRASAAAPASRILVQCSTSRAPRPSGCINFSASRDFQSRTRAAENITKAVGVFRNWL